MTQEMLKVECSRCLGSGKYSFNLKDGDMCYGCKGKGYVHTTQTAINAAAKRKAAAQARLVADREEMERKNKAQKNMVILLTKAYRHKNDKRLALLANIPEQYHYMHILEWAEKDGLI